MSDEWPSQAPDYRELLEQDLPFYRWAKDHPCYGCLYTKKLSQPVCTLGSTPERCLVKKRGWKAPKITKRSAP